MSRGSIRLCKDTRLNLLGPIEDGLGRQLLIEGRTSNMILRKDISASLGYISMFG